MKNQLLGCFVPGLPHVLSADKSPAWAKLKTGFMELGKAVQAENPDVIVIHSSQWMSVLGTSFQVRKNLKGVHVDENWHELGDLPFDFNSDVALGVQFSKDAKLAGFPVKLIDYEEFPIDTGTIVAMNYLNPGKKIPVAIVSSWVYADHDKNYQLGQVMAETVKRSGKKALFLSSSLLSARYFTDEIDPKSDRISDSNDDKWNQTLLGLFELGNMQEAVRRAKDFKSNVPCEMQFNAFFWLAGTLAGQACRGQVFSYGPQWGTGAAVVGFHREGMPT